MKNLFTVLGLLILSAAHGQYFQWRFNLDYNKPLLRNERCNSGIRTRVNYINNNPAFFYFTSIGTSYNNVALPAPDNRADRMRFIRLGTQGTVLFSNLGYQFSDADSLWFHSSGNSIAEVKNNTGTGGYVAVGAITNNTVTGANTIPGNSDALFVRLNATGGVVSARRIDINKGTDIAWCIRKSNVLVNNQPTWLICGQSQHGKDYTDCFVARVFVDGTIVWCNQYNFDPTGGTYTSAHCIAKQLCEDAAGYIYVVGTLRDNPAGANGTDGLAFRLTPAGVITWANNYQAATDDEFQAVRLTADNSLIVGGFTNFNAAAPVVHNMLIVKLALANGGIIFQRILQANTGNAVYTSRCYDIIENGTGANAQYYLAGPAINANGVIMEMMYRTNAAGFPINWYTYNRMRFNVGFGLDNIDAGNSRGVAYFASLIDSISTAFSDSHIMTTNYNGQTCKFCGAFPPFYLPINLQVSAREHRHNAVGQPRLLKAKLFRYDADEICNESVLHCNDLAATNAESSEAAAATISDGSKDKDGMNVFPNPVTSLLHVQLNAKTAGEYQVTLANMEGRIIVDRSKVFSGGKSFTDIDMSSVKPGVYLLTVRRGTWIAQQKVVKH